MLYRYIINKLPYRRLETAVYEATLAIFSRLHNYVPDHRFYGFALCTDCDVRSLFWTANSEGALETQAKEWLRRTQQSLSESAPEFDVALQLYRFEPRDWRFHEEWLRSIEGSHSEPPQKFQVSNESLARIWDIFDRIPMSEDRRFLVADDVRRNCLNAIVSGLSRADREIDWSPDTESGFDLRGLQCSVSHVSRHSRVTCAERHQFFLLRSSPHESTVQSNRSLTVGYGACQ